MVTPAKKHTIAIIEEKWVDGAGILIIRAAEATMTGTRIKLIRYDAVMMVITNVMEERRIMNARVK